MPSSWRPRKPRAASEIEAQFLGRMLLYENLKPAILWVLSHHQYTSRDGLAALVAREYYRVRNLSGDAKRALEQAVREAAGDLLQHEHIEETEGGNLKAKS